MTTAYRVVDTPWLRQLVAEARRHHFNRIPDLDRIDLDPEGRHIVNLVLFDHTRMMQPAGSQPDPVHHRTRVMMKVTGKKDPVETYLDVVAGTYEQLPAVPDEVVDQTGAR